MQNQPMISLAAAARALIVVAITWFAHAALRDATAAVVREEPPGTIAAATGILVAACIALSLALRFYRARPFGSALILPAILIAVFATAYAQQIRSAEDPGGPLPSIGAAPKSDTMREGHPGRPPVLYAFNRHGFRGPEWDFESTGARLCLIGDSYVFGSGVEWEGTLGEALRRRLPETEVLNLGVPGHNLRSHLTLYEFAVDRLDCDRIAMALVLPNDLSRFDINSEILLKSSVSAYSITEFVFGPQLPARIWNTRELSHSTGPDELAMLETQWKQLGALRARFGNTPLILFTYGTDEGLAALPPLTGVQRLPHARYDPAHYIPNDGHPNAAGNEEVAQNLATALANN